MKFRILGPLQIYDEQHLEPREQRVLAVLLLSPGRLVTRQHLIDTVWDENPPVTAGRQLLNCISRLRRRLGPDVIHSGSAGYRLDAAQDELDAHLFARLLAAAETLQASGQLAAAAQQLRTALELWRGPALAGIGGRVIEAAASRLEETRLNALEQCLGFELALGAAEASIGELAELVTAHPLRERAVGLLMQALRRSGRQADALAVYQQLGERLAEELGLDPGPELRGLHTAILRGEDDPPRTASALVVPRQLPAAIRHFAGRRAELKELNTLLAEVGGSGLVISVVDGTAGIGKTALALHWAHGAAASFPDGQLYVNLRGFEPSGKPSTPVEVIRGFLDALGVPSDQVPADLAAQTALYRSLIAGRRILVVLDNARDADQVRPLLPGTPACLAIVTSRNHLTGLAAAEGAHTLSLDLLTPDDAYDLLVRRLGKERIESEPEATQALIAACARLPLALAIVAGRASVHPSFPLSNLVKELADARLDALDTGDSTAQVRAVFSWSYHRLSPAAARVFRLLGLHRGADVSLAATASLAGTSLAEARQAVLELAQSHLLTEHLPGRHTFHDLLRAYASEQAQHQESGPARAEAAQRLLDHYLHTAYAGDRILDPTREPLVLQPPRTGVQPEPPATHDEALRWFSEEHQVILSAINLAAHLGFDAHAWQLAWCLSTYFVRHGHWQDWLAAQHTALGATQRLSDRLGEARSHNALGMAYAEITEFASSHHHLECASAIFGELGDHTGQARVCMNLCWILEQQERYSEALDQANRAHQHYVIAGHQAGEADALNNIGWYHGLLGNHDESLEWCGQALESHRRLGNVMGQADALDSLGYAFHQLGHYARACARYREAFALYLDCGDRSAEADVLTHLGDSLHASGLIDAARHAYRGALDIFEELEHRDVAEVQVKFASTVAELARAGE